MLNCDIVASSEEKYNEDQLHFGKNKVHETPKSTMQNNCDVNGDISDIKTHFSVKKDNMKTITSVDNCLTLISECVELNHIQPTTMEEESVFSDSRTDAPSIKTSKQSYIKVGDAEDHMKDLPVQLQLHDSNSVNASELVNNTSPVKSQCTSSTRNNPASETIQHSPSKEIQRSETNIIKSSMQDQIGDISPCKTSQNITTNNISSETFAVNKDEDNSTNDRPSDLSVTSEKTVCKVTSSCSEVANSIFVGSSQSNDNASDVTDVNTQARCTPSEESSPVKACVSATQKRKVC